MDSSSASTSAKKYTLPTKFCDIESLDGVLTNTKSKTATPKQVKYTMPVRMCDLDWGLLGPRSAKKSSVRKELWKTQKENKSATKIQKNSPSGVKSKKGFFHDENLPLVDLETYDQSPNFSKKSKTFKCNRLSLAKPKKMNCPTIVTEILHQEDVPSIRKPIPRNKDAFSLIKPPSPNSPPNAPSTSIDEQKLIELFDKKINEFTNKIESKYNEILLRLDKIELNKSALCAICAKKSYTSTSSSSYAQNDINSSCFIVENDKIIEPHTTDFKDTSAVDTPIINDLINDALSKIDRNSKPKQLFNDVSVPLEDSVKDKKLLDSVEQKLNKFELLEARLETESPKSFEVSLSDTDSPLVQKEDMAWILRDNKESNITKFISAPTLRCDSYGMYNEIRDNVKFLCTPKNTKTLSNLMTPSVENSQKKLISRRIQKQLLMLD